jgi:hypothetical protein
MDQLLVYPRYNPIIFTNEMSENYLKGLLKMIELLIEIIYGLVVCLHGRRLTCCLDLHRLCKYYQALLTTIYTCKPRSSGYSRFIHIPVCCMHACMSMKITFSFMHKCVCLHVQVQVCFHMYMHTWACLYTSRFHRI